MKINARDCIIEEVSRQITEEFLEENHNQGKCNYMISYGLFFKGELVQVITFGIPRFNKNFQWELLRDCTKKDYIIRGGVSKLWKHFIANNIVHSCVCYSYPHKDDLYTSKYVDFCGFKNIKRAKPEEKVYFEGIWNGKIKRIDKSILERHGVDRLLKTKQGHDRTNEQILLDLGFEKKYEDGMSPQVDSYFPFGLVYRVDDLDDGSFYIGKCEVKEKWKNGYKGSGKPKWNNHKKKYPPIDEKPDHPNAHHYKRTILKDDFKTPKEMFDYESKEIKQYFEKDNNGDYKLKDKKCCNSVWWSQGARRSCSECGSYLNHKKTCSKYKEPERCHECGAIVGHKKSCSQFKVTYCDECGKPMSNHLKTCSYYTKKKCPECGSYTVHRKGCSKYVNPKPAKKCKECGHIPHLKTCSQYNPKICEECGGKFKHKKTCSKYKQDKKPELCSECGGSMRNHFKTCSKYKPVICKECGGLSGHHKEECSKYNKSRICKECGGGQGRHKKNCSKYISSKRPEPCEECGGRSGMHLKTCSKFKEKKACLECGSKSHHKTWCSKYVKQKTCEECGGKFGHHYESCSKFKKPKGCPECGSSGQHKSWCSRRKVR